MNGGGFGQNTYFCMKFICKNECKNKGNKINETHRVGWEITI